MSINFFTKKLFWIILILVYADATAQQVKKIDCCKDVNPKATIIINDNTAGSNASATVSTNPANGIFNFELKSDLNTSAGVYNSDGVLIRTLWSGMRYDAGCYEAQWDGMMDDGVTVAAFGSYTIKILTNNVQYVWEGGIGDSSTEPYSDRKLRGNDYNSLVVVGNSVYGSVGYSEHETALKTSGLSDINLINPPSGATEMNILNVTTDGNLIYLAGDKSGNDGTADKYVTWVQAIHPGDVNLSQNPVSFASQQTVTANSGSGALTENHAISVIKGQPDSYSHYPNGIAVQKSGNFLFVLRTGINQLQVIDKRISSGAAIQTLNFQDAQSITCDDDNNLFATYSPTTTGTITTVYAAANKLTGTPIGSPTQGGTTAANAFDGDFNTFFDGQNSSGGFVGLDLGSMQVVKSIAYAARSGLENRLSGTIIQGSINGVDYVNLLTISSAAAGKYTTENLNNTTAYRYYRALSSNGGYTNISELAFFASQFSIGRSEFIKKFKINSDGTLTDTGISFSSINSATKITYSLALNKLSIFDNITKQIKIFNPSGGVPEKIIGELGGYSTSPYFSETRFVDANFLYYQPDGTLWIGQPALHSVLHYDLNFHIIGQSQHLPTSRCITADQNNPTRVFANYSEYQRDYTKPLDNGKNGSWKLVANWIKGQDGAGNYDGLSWVSTLSNGRTYGIVYTGGRKQLNELTSTGLRLISDYFAGDIGRDGTVLIYGDNGSYGNQPTGMYRRLLTGFDSSNNPVWTAPALWIKNPQDNTFYTPWYGYTNGTTGITSAASGYTYFNNGTSPDQTIDNSGNIPGYRLGFVGATTGKPVWKTARTTFYNYSGPYPVDGSFDIGNNTGYLQQHSETHAMVYDDDIFWNVNGEFWQNTEANHWNQVDGKTGLLISHFGTDGNISKLFPGNPEMAGNAFSTGIVKVGNDYYIYHCDESVHAFVHSWHVSGLNTIKVMAVPITVINGANLSNDPTDMMAGIPYKSNSFFGGKGWTMQPSAGISDEPSNSYPTWKILTTKNSYTKFDNDIFVESSGNGNGEFKTISRNLGYDVATGTTTVINSNNWTLTGSLKINSNLNDHYNVDLLDKSGKVLAVINTRYSFFYINGSRYAENVVDARLMCFTFIPFKIQSIYGKISCSVGGAAPILINSYETGGNFSQPANFRIRAGGNGDNQHTIMSIKRLNFSKN